MFDEHPATPAHIAAPLTNPFDNRGRTDSLISVDTVYMNDYPPNNVFSRQRNNSDVSLSSSVFSEAQRPQLDTYNFSPQFDDQLFSYYISYSQQPNITPFDIRFPPSGILSRISKLFLENCILPVNMQIDTSSQEANNELLNPQNRHNLLAVIRLRLIHMCNINLNAGCNDFGDANNYNDLLPMSRTNSIVSAMSFNDKVLPNFDLSTTNNVNTNNSNSTTTSANNSTLQSKNSWLNINPSLYSARFNKSNLNSTDSIDRIDEFSNLSLPQRRDRPSLNLHLPPLPSATNNGFKPVRPSFNIGQSPLTPGTPNTPGTPTGSYTNLYQRNNYPRAARSASLSNPRPNYLNLPPNQPSSYLNPTLNNIAAGAGINQLDLQSPFEQAFPSPMYPQQQQQQQPSQQASPVNQYKNAPLPQLPVTTDCNGDLYNATVSRKRESLKLKRAP